MSFFDEQIVPTTPVVSLPEQYMTVPELRYVLDVLEFFDSKPFSSPISAVVHLYDENGEYLGRVERNPTDEPRGYIFSYPQPEDPS